MQQMSGHMRKVKPVVHGTSRLHWARNLISNILRVKTLMVLSTPRSDNQPDLPPDEEEETTDTDDEDDTPVDRDVKEDSTPFKEDPTAFKVYGCLAQLLRAWVNFEPLSTVLGTSSESHESDSSKDIYCVYRIGGRKALYRMIPDGESTFRFGLYYTDFDYDSVGDQNNVGSLKSLEDLTIYGYAVLLPLLVEDQVHKYAVINDSWQVMDYNCQMVTPDVYTVTPDVYTDKDYTEQL